MLVPAPSAAEPAEAGGTSESVPGVPALSAARAAGTEDPNSHDQMRFAGGGGSSLGPFLVVAIGEEEIRVHGHWTLSRSTAVLSLPAVGGGKLCAL